VDIIEGHAAEPLTVEDVAEAVGIGVRALQQDFRRYLDTTPTNYLRGVRFRRPFRRRRRFDSVKRIVDPHCPR
jgi:transcriptional regulator GlxA family with amidase domain